jgi:hypothetical protein
MSIKLLAHSIFALVTGTAFAALAQPGPAPKLVKMFEDWGVYSYTSEGALHCYVLSAPRKALPAGVDHGSNFFLVAPNPAGIGYYPQAVMGYELRANSEMSVSVDSKSFSMMPKGNAGWTRNSGDDASLINAMKGGRSLSLRAVSKRGTQTTYTFSLAGISAALVRAGQRK